MEELRNKDPEFVTDFFASAATVLSEYGWYLLVIVSGLLYVTYKLQPHIERYLKRKSDDEFASKYHKNPELLEVRMAAMEEARRKMQEKHNDMTEVYKIKAKEREEQKRQEWIKKQVGNDSCGQKLGGKPKDNSKKSLQSDYSPLMTDNTGGRYRAPKRSACSGGGCGK